jgi:hypothetical protein
VTCKVIQTNEGTIIACTRGQRETMCSECKVRKATLLCDFKLRGALSGRTCDRPLCAKCTTKTDDGRDLCKPHSKWSEPEEEK